MSKPTIIRFSKSWQGYGPGEVAGFPAAHADQLIKAGLAELHGKGKPAPAAASQSDSKPAAAAPEATPDVDEDKKP